MNAHSRAVASVPASAPVLEVGRYRARDGERVICAERVERFVYITDRPARGPGRSYFIDRCLASDGNGSVEALVADYTRRARRLQEIPMAAGQPTGIDEVALGRYRFSGGQRVLYGQRVNGVVRVTDRPASGGGRCYLVEMGLEGDGYGALRALVCDYVREASRLDDIPMARSQARLLAREASPTRCPRSAEAVPA